MNNKSLLFVLIWSELVFGMIPPPFPPPPPPPRIPRFRKPPFIIPPPPPPPPMIPNDFLQEDNNCWKSAFGYNRVSLQYNDPSCQVIGSLVRTSSRGYYVVYVKDGSLGKGGVCKVMNSAGYDEDKVIGTFSGENYQAIHQCDDSPEANLYIECFTGRKFEYVEFEFMLVTTFSQQVEWLPVHLGSFTYPLLGCDSCYIPMHFIEWKYETPFESVNIHVEVEIFEMAPTDVLLIVSDDHYTPTQTIRESGVYSITGGNLRVQLISGTARGRVTRFHIQMSPFRGPCSDQKYLPSEPVDVEIDRRCQSYVYSFTANEHPQMAIYVEAHTPEESPYCKVYDIDSGSREIGTVGHENSYMVVSASNTVYVVCTVLHDTPVGEFTIHALPFVSASCGGFVSFGFSEHGKRLTGPDMPDDQPQYCEWQINVPPFAQQSIQSYISSLTLGFGEALLINGYDESIYVSDVTDLDFEAESLQYMKPVIIQYVVNFPITIDLEVSCSKFCPSVHTSQTVVKINWEEPVGDVSVNWGFHTLKYIWNPTEICFSNLSPNTLYHYLLKPKDGEELKVNDVPGAAATVPGKTEPPRVVSVSGDSVKLDWPLYVDGNLPLGLYEVRVFNEFDEKKRLFHGLTGEMEDLEPGTQYMATVAAVNHVKYGYGIPSDPIEFETLAIPKLHLESCPTPYSLLFEIGELHNEDEDPNIEICWCLTLSGVQCDFVSTGRSHTIDNLLPNTRYFVYLKRLCDDGSVKETPRRIYATGPQPLSTPNIDSKTPSSITLTWPTYREGDAEIIGYHVEVLNTNISKFVHHTSATIGGLDGYTEYSITVAAKNYDCLGVPSSAVMATTDLGPARNLRTIDCQATNITFEWDPPTGNHGTRLILSLCLTEHGACFPVGEPPYTITTLDSGSKYFVHMEAGIDHNSDGVRDGNVTSTPSIVAYTVPEAPTSLTAIEIGTNSALLTWSASLTPYITGYIITVGQNEEIHHSIDTSYYLTNLMANNDTTVKIAAFILGDISKVGEESEEITVCTEPAPFQIHQIEQNSTTNSISFELVPQDSGYKRSVLYHTVCVDYTETFNTTSLVFDIDGLEPSTNYDVYVKTTYDDGTVVESDDRDAATVPANASTPVIVWRRPRFVVLEVANEHGGSAIDRILFKINGSVCSYSNYGEFEPYNKLKDLVGNTEYTLTAAFCNYKCGVESSPVNFTTLPYGVKRPNMQNATTSSVTVTWSEPPLGGGVQALRGYRLVADGVTRPIQLNRSVTFYMPPNSKKLFKIETVYDMDVVESRPFFALTAPLVAPSNFTVWKERQTSIGVSFTAPPGGSAIAGYIFSYTYDGGEGMFYHTSDSTWTYIQGLLPNTHYWFVARAYNRAGEGADSQPFPAVTAPGPPRDLHFEIKHPHFVIVHWAEPHGDFERLICYSVVLLTQFGAELQRIETMETHADLFGLDPRDLYVVLVSAVYDQSEVHAEPLYIVSAPPPQLSYEIEDLAELKIGVHRVPVEYQGLYLEILTHNESLVDVVYIRVRHHKIRHVFDLEPNTLYIVKGRWLVEENGFAKVRPEYIVTYAPAIEPENIRLVSQTNTTIEIEWDPYDGPGDQDIISYNVIWSPYIYYSEHIETSNTTVTVTGLQPEHKYSFGVLVKNAGGYSPHAYPVMFETESSFVPYPRISTKHPPTLHSITLGWRHPLSCAPPSMYKVNYQQTSGNQSHSGMVNVTEIRKRMRLTVEDLLPNTVYEFTVAAVRGSRIGEESEPVSACTLPNPVRNTELNVYANGSTIFVSWDQSNPGGDANITKYKVSWISAEDRGHTIVHVTNGDRLSVTITDLQFATFYRVSVQAMNAHGFGQSPDSVRVSTGSGIVCGNIITIKLSAEDIAEKLVPEAGDQVVISRSARTTVDAGALASHCKALPMPGNPLAFTFDLTECEPQQGHPVDEGTGLEDRSVTTFSYTVQAAREIDVSQIIQRIASSYVFVYTCSFDNTRTVSSDKIRPRSMKSVQVMATESGHFEVELDLYVSNDFDTPLPGNPPSIAAFSPIYGQLKILANSSDLYLQTKRCWATPTESDGDAIFYPIILHGVAVHLPSDSNAYTEVIQNYQLLVTQFKFTAFVWTHLGDHDQSMYVHCNLQICDTESGLDCQVLPRGRRSITSTKSHVITYGPIELVKQKAPEDLCQENNGGCEDNCLVVEQSIVCACRSGRVLNEDGRTCTDDIIEETGMVLTAQNKLLFCILMVMLALLIWKKFL